MTTETHHIGIKDAGSEASTCPPFHNFILQYN